MTSHSIEGLSDGGLREKIARVIDPVAWASDDLVIWAPGGRLLVQGRAYVKADAILALLSAAPERVEGGGWRPIAEAHGKPGTYINVRSVTTYRWLEYKPDGKRQMRRDGRWQKAVGDYGGWQNEELPERGEFRPNLPASASPPIGAEGGRPTSASDSGCGEGTQEPSPSGAQSDDGRGGS